MAVRRQQLHTLRPWRNKSWQSGGAGVVLYLFNFWPTSCLPEEAVCKTLTGVKVTGLICPVFFLRRWCRILEPNEWLII